MTTTERMAEDFAGIFNVPESVGAVVHEFRSCEFSTLARDGTPVTWPTLPFFDHANGRFLITCSIGLAQKAFNVRRDGRVAMLFSNPTGAAPIAAAGPIPGNPKRRKTDRPTKYSLAPPARFARQRLASTMTRHAPRLRSSRTGLADLPPRAGAGIRWCGPTGS